MEYTYCDALAPSGVTQRSQQLLRVACQAEHGQRARCETTDADCDSCFAEPEVDCSVGTSEERVCQSRQGLTSADIVSWGTHCPVLAGTGLETCRMPRCLPPQLAPLLRQLPGAQALLGLQSRHISSAQPGGP